MAIKTTPGGTLDDFISTSLRETTEQLEAYVKHAALLVGGIDILIRDYVLVPIETEIRYDDFRFELSPVVSYKLTQSYRFRLKTEEEKNFEDPH